MNEPIIEAADDLAAWTASPAGAYLLRWEQAQFDAAVADVFGYYALQLGLPALDCLRANRIACRIQARTGPGASPTPGGAARGDAVGLAAEDTAGVRAPPRGLVRIEHPEELPFETQSLDLVALPHALELASDPHQVLREVDRVLRPEGRLIVSGLNPISLWGARHVLPGGLLPGALRSSTHLIAPPRLRDWLKLLGFEPERAQYGCYRPPCRTQAWLDRTGFLERPGDRWWPICGAAYLLPAVKRVRAMRLVGPAWKKPAAARAPAPVAVASSRAPRQAGGGTARRDGPPRDFSDTCTRETAAAD